MASGLPVLRRLRCATPTPSAPGSGIAKAAKVTKVKQRNTSLAPKRTLLRSVLSFSQLGRRSCSTPCSTRTSRTPRPLFCLSSSSCTAFSLARQGRHEIETSNLKAETSRGTGRPSSFPEDGQALPRLASSSSRPPRDVESSPHRPSREEPSRRGQIVVPPPSSSFSAASSSADWSRGTRLISGGG